MDSLTIGLLGLGFLVGLIAIRVPIAYAMIAVGGVGIGGDNPIRIQSMITADTLSWLMPT